MYQVIKHNVNQRYFGTEYNYLPDGHEQGRKAESLMPQLL